MKQFLESPNLLQTIETETNKNSDEASQLVAGLSESQLNWKPAPERWSIAQCLNHLAVSAEGFTPYLRLAIDKGRQKHASRAPIAYRPTLLGGWLARQLLPETTRKMRAPKIFQPSELPIEGAPNRFLKAQEAFLGFVREADGMDFNRVRLRSPVTALLRYSLADAFVINVVHGQRHLAQARHVKEAPEFPKE